MTDYTALAARVAQPDLAALSEQQAADALNAPGSGDGVAYQDVDPADWYDTLLTSGEWGRIELFSRLAPTGTLATPSAQDNNVARLLTFVRIVTFDRPIRASRQSVRDVLGTILTAMQTGGFIAAGTRTALIGFAQRPASWGEANGFPRGVTSRDVGLARGGKS
jgi:hypothetical protein